MKPLFLSALIAAVSIAGHHRKAHAASVQELCVSGKVSSTTTPAQGPNIAVTSCEWASSARITSNPSTAKSLVVSGGTTLGAVTIDVGTPVGSMSLALDKFSSTFPVALVGQLKAGSSVAITSCSFTLKAVNSINLVSLSFAGTNFDFSRNVVTISLNQQFLKIPACSAACAYTVNDNLFNHTLTLTASVIEVFNNAAVHHSITFESRRNTFMVSPTFYSSVGYAISPKSIVSTLGSPPANWSLVTDQQARTLYGKSTYVIADNVFDSITFPWSITDVDGADFTIENNTAKSRLNAIAPKYIYSGNYYRLNSVIRNNTLTITGSSNSYLDLTFKTLPAHSLVRIRNNTITTGISSGTNPRIVRMQGAAIYGASALIEISGNILLSSTGITGLRGGTVYSMYSSYAYTVVDEALLPAAAAIMLFENILFTVPIITHKLTLSTVFFANMSRVLPIDSPYPWDTTTTTTSTTTTTKTTTTTTVAPTTTTAAPTTTTAAPTTTTAAPTTTTAAPTTTTAAPTTTTAAPTTTTAAPTTTTVAPTTTLFSYSENVRRPSASSIWIFAVTFGVYVLSARALQ